MSLITTIETDAVNILKEAASLVTKAKAIWNTFSSTQNRTLALTLFADAVKLVSDGTSAAEQGTFNLVLDEQVVADINKIVTDAKAGNTVITADLALLGIKL